MVSLWSRAFHLLIRGRHILMAFPDETHPSFVGKNLRIHESDRRPRPIGLIMLSPML